MNGEGDENIRQIGALPYRTAANGDVEVMLITSRETRRWVVPKGNPIPGLSPHEAAAQEAYEEAGIRGIASPRAIGHYGYVKRRRTRADRDLIVTVFPLAVSAQAADWPERDQRETRWFSLEAAAEAVDEPDLKTLIAEFRVPVSAAPPTDGNGSFALPRGANDGALRPPAAGIVDPGS